MTADEMIIDKMTTYVMTAGYIADKIILDKWL